MPGLSARLLAMAMVRLSAALLGAQSEGWVVRPAIEVQTAVEQKEVPTEVPTAVPMEVPTAVPTAVLTAVLMAVLTAVLTVVAREGLTEGLTVDGSAGCWRRAD